MRVFNPQVSKVCHNKVLQLHEQEKTIIQAFLFTTSILYIYFFATERLLIIYAYLLGLQFQD